MTPQEMLAQWREAKALADKEAQVPVDYAAESAKRLPPLQQEMAATLARTPAEGPSGPGYDIVRRQFDIIRRQEEAKVAREALGSLDRSEVSDDPVDEMDMRIIEGLTPDDAKSLDLERPYQALQAEAKAETEDKEDLATALQLAAEKAAPPAAPPAPRPPFRREPAFVKPMSAPSTTPPTRPPGASPFQAERLPVRAEDVILNPLERRLGTQDVDPAEAERQLESLYLQRASRDKKDYGPEELQSMQVEAKDKARRTIAGLIQSSVPGAGLVAETRPGRSIEEIRRGEGLPLPLQAFGLGGVAAANRFAAKYRGLHPGDTAVGALISVVGAMSRPGTGTYDTETGTRVINASSEGRLWWLLRLAPSTAVASWLLDPEMTWSIGGETGVGGERQTRKITSGYDLFHEVGRTSQAFDSVIPGDHPTISKIPAYISLMTAAIVEPDLVSLVAGPVGKAVKTGIKGVAGGGRIASTVIAPEMARIADGISAGKPLEEVFDAKPGTAADIMQKLVRAAAIDTLHASPLKSKEAAELISRVDPEQMRNLPTLVREADAAVEAASRNVGDATKLVDELAEESDAIKKSVSKWADDYGSSADALSDALTKLAQERIAWAQARAIEATTEGWAGSKKLRMGPLKAGEELVAPSGEVFHYIGKGPSPWPKGRGKPEGSMRRMALVRGADGQTVLRDPLTLSRRGASGDPDVVVQEVAKIHDDYMKLLRQRKVILDAGESTAKVDKSLAEMSAKFADYAMRSSMITREVRVIEAVDQVQRATEALLEVSSRRPDPKLVRAGLADAVKDLNEALALKAEAVRSLENAKLPAKLINKLRRRVGEIARVYESQAKKFDLNTRQVEAMKFEPVTPELAKRDGAGVFSVDKNEYFRRLENKYSKDVVDKLQSSVLGSSLKDIDFQRLSPRQLTALSSFENAAFNYSKNNAAWKTASTRVLLNTLRDADRFSVLSPSGFSLRAFQFVEGARSGDWIGASSMGRAPKATQDIVLRAYERYAFGEVELNKVGLERVREYLTSSNVMSGVVGNRDPVTYADRALRMLQWVAEADPEAWASNMVVRAIANAAHPMGRASSGEVERAIIRELKEFVQDPGATSTALYDFAVRVGQKVREGQGMRVGTQQATEVMVARAVLQAANMHDVVYDTMRINGPRMAASAINGMNWLIHTNPTPKGPVGAQVALRYAHAYGLPLLSASPGGLKNATEALLTGAKQISNQLSRLAVVQGADFVIPNRMQDALDSIPRNMVTKLSEYGGPKNRTFENLMQFARTWRVAQVYGYLLVRPANYVNTAFSDWSQLSITFGLGKGAAITAASSLSYLPFIGPRVYDAIAKVGSKTTIIPQAFSPDLNRVLRVDPDLVVETADGPLDGVTFFREMVEDGFRDSIAGRDLADAAARTVDSWKILRVPGHVRRFAEFAENVQARNRALVYLMCRTGRMTGTPLSRSDARAKMVDALYDWKTGVPEWEQKSIGLISLFYTQRRLMLRQLGAIISEGLSEPSAMYIGRAFRGDTKLARLRQLGLGTAGLQRTINWTDPAEELDDREQIEAMLLNQLPWWEQGGRVLMNRLISKPRGLYYSDVMQRDVTVESLMLPTITHLDMLNTINLSTQTVAATSVHLGESMGLRPSYTTIPVSDIWERNVQAVAGTLFPGVDGIVESAMVPMLSDKSRHPSAAQVTPAEAVLLRKLGWEDFMAAYPDADGKIRIDAGAYGLATALTLRAVPPISDSIRAYGLFAANPGTADSGTSAFMHAFGVLTNLGRTSGHDPLRSQDFTAREAAARIKSEVKKAEKAVTPASER